MILSQCINDYLTLLITMVHECHGDIITFAGDAFLAFWQYDPSVADNSTPATPLLHAANCALKLQEKYHTYQVPGTSVILKIHIGIAYGSFYGIFPYCDTHCCFLYSLELVLLYLYICNDTLLAYLFLALFLIILFSCYSYHSLLEI